jgi:tetratricopeptide (TPR) repeat protein
MDPYLDALMHGEHPHKKKSSKEEQAPKSKIEIEQDKEIDSFVNAFEFEEDPERKSALDPKLKREKLKISIKEAMKMPELSHQMDTAIGLLFSEGSRYLSPEVHQKLVSDLTIASDELEDIGLEEAANSNLQTLSKMSEESVKGIQEIALAKFKEERYADSVSLFSLLSILNPGYSEYWFRLGIAAQKDGEFDLASRAYSATQSLDPDNIGAKLFAAECFIQRGLLHDAQAELAAAEAINKESKADKMWVDMISAIHEMLKEKQH